MRRRVLTGLAAAVAMMLPVLLAPTAWAGGPPDPAADAAGSAADAAAVTGSPPASPTGTVVLAHTGLDIAVPMAIGLAVLVVGTALVAWAVLRGSRSRGSHT